MAKKSMFGHFRGEKGAGKQRNYKIPGAPESRDQNIDRTIQSSDLPTCGLMLPKRHMHTNTKFKILTLLGQRIVPCLLPS